MALKRETLTCLKERLLNASPKGRVFSSAEAHRQWLVGRTGAEPGLVHDPRGALGLSVPAPDPNGPAHAGVALSEEEESEVRSFLDRVFFGNSGLLPRLATAGPKGGGVALDCPNPYDPACWY